MAIWCGGIKSNKLTNNINNNLNNNCKFGIPISNTLNVISPKLNFSNIFAIGDCSYSKLPPTAQVAYQQGQYLANNFNKDFKNINNFKYQDKGKICYIGNSKSVFHINYFHYGGNLTYYLNKFIHIYNAVNLNQKTSFMHNFIF
jgi:NADH:ubiquinone reductase (non-electrogenic)